MLLLGNHRGGELLAQFIDDSQLAVFSEVLLRIAAHSCHLGWMPSQFYHILQELFTTWHIDRVVCVFALHW